MRELYRAAWARLAVDRETCHDIEREATPVLCFGRWDTARVATAGLNPSEDEFRTGLGAGRTPLAGTAQRFLHWNDGALTEERLNLALDRMGGYFTLGNAYTRWFDRYTGFLASVGTTFGSGSACHTDYVSPFATRSGISKCRPGTRRFLAMYGEPTWVEVMRRCPNLELVFGHGGGWRRAAQLLKAGAGWERLATPFDHKGSEREIAAGHLWFLATPGVAGRPLLLYWWRPNRNGSPFCYLSGKESGTVGEIVRKHANERGALL